MLRSLYSGISGLRSHQTMLDVTGNNIANVNTTGFKGSAVQFQDTLSQTLTDGGAATDDTGATNPAQVGLGVKVAGTSTNFAQGAGQATGRATDLMISGDGFFAVQSGGETLYSRAGALNFDTDGRLVTADGGLVQGWSATNGVVNTGGALSTVTLSAKAINPAAATTSVTFSGNLPSDATAPLVRDFEVYDAAGNSTTRTVTLTPSATVDGQWTITDSAGNTTGNLVFGADGTLVGDGIRNLGGISLDFSASTGAAKVNTFGITEQSGHAAGTLTSYSIGKDGTVTGAFSNGTTAAIAQIALATFANTGGLEKTGGSYYSATPSSGAATLGVPGQGGVGSLDAGYLEMSNVDLSQEFTNLIVAQRGFQANARIITTSDEVLQELTNLKR
ncbi:MAG: flagellar hook protein [Glaciihabitans sp.]|nr:flagellar hook protein [Glaciihabitans sp.]